MEIHRKIEGIKKRCYQSVRLSNLSVSEPQMIRRRDW